MAEELPVPEHTAQEVKDKLAEILSGNEFRPRPKSLLDRLTGSLGDFFNWLLGPISKPSIGDTSLLEFAIMAVLVVLVVLVVLRLTRTMRKGGRVRFENHVQASMRQTGKVWRQEAEAHERAGAWRLALRCRYRAFLADLVDRDVIADIPGRTAGEYRDEVQNRYTRIAEPLKGMTDLFQGSWYGNESVGADEAQLFQELANQVLAVADSGDAGLIDSSVGQSYERPR